jgi:lysine decarboxylase
VTDPRDSSDPGDPRDPRGLAADAPLLDAWLRFTAQAEAGTLTPMSVPGHKQRRDLTGTVTAGDAPLYGGLDSIKHADELLAEGERRAAQLWGADWCRFSVAGSTHGNQALALAAGEPGRPIVITRALHRSLLLGIVLAGLEPVWVLPEVDPATGLPGPVPVRAVADALARHPDACAVFLGDPSYVGTTGDLAGHAAAAHEAGVPLLVDAAWAAHLGFHPGLPPHALAAGADAMVTSAHKALPAYTQGALVLARTAPATGTSCAAGCCARSRRPRTGCARYPAWMCWTARESSPPNWSSCWPGPGRTASRWRPTSSRRACRWRWPTATRSSRSSPWLTTRPR